MANPRCNLEARDEVWNATKRFQDKEMYYLVYAASYEDKIGALGLYITDELLAVIIEMVLDCRPYLSDYFQSIIDGHKKEQVNG